VFLDTDRPEVRVRPLPMYKQPGQASAKHPDDKGSAASPGIGDARRAAFPTTKREP
jgi:hypothetical protein